MTDEEIVLKVRGGDGDAFAELVRKYSNAVYAVAYSRLGDYHEAQDAAQEVFLGAYTHLYQLRAPAKVGSWLYSMASRLSVRWHTRRPPHVALDERRLHGITQSSFDPGVREALEKLSEVNRQTLILYYVAGYKTREIAEFVGASSDAVEKRLRRAREYLRREMLELIEGDASENRLGELFVSEVAESLRRVRPLYADAGAIAGLRQRVAECPSDAASLSALARTLYTVGLSEQRPELLEEAVERFTELIGLGGDEPLGLGYSYLYLGQPGRAMECFARGGRDVMAQLGIAHARKQLGQSFTVPAELGEGVSLLEAPAFAYFTVKA